MPLVVHSVVGLLNGDFARSRALFHTRAADVWGGIDNVAVVAAALYEMMLGLPDAALVTVAQLDDFDFPNMDGTEVLALAYLALGDTETAMTFIHRLAKRAATGVYGAESNDAMLLLAASPTTTATTTRPGTASVSPAWAARSAPPPTDAISPDNSASSTNTSPTLPP